MNREIAYKAWDGFKMHKVATFDCARVPAYWFTPLEGFDKEMRPHQGDVHNRKDYPNFVLLQYTGLKDKINNPIYEGDIVRCSEGLPLTGHPPKDKLPKHGIRKVIFHEGAFKIGVGNDSKRYHLTSLSIRYCGLEIIGNIYQNPELLNPNQ